MKNKKNTLLKKIFISYIIVVIAPIIFIGTITLNVLFADISDEIKELNIDLLNQSKESIDMNLRNIKSMTFHLSRSKDVINFARGKFEKSADKTYLASFVLNELRRHSIYSELVDSVAICFRDENIIITQEFKYTPQEYFGQNFSGGDLTFEKWDEFVQNVGIQAFIPVVRETGEQNTDVLVYIQPLTNVDQSNGVIFITTIRSDTLLDLFKQALKDAEGYFMAVDLQGNIIVRSKEIPFEFDLSFVPTNGSGKFDFTSDGKNYIGIHTASEVIGLKYIYILSQEKIEEGLGGVRVSFMLISLVTMIFVIMVLYFDTKKRYSPIQAVINRMKKIEQKNTGLKSEMALLDNFVEGILKENMKLGEKVTEQKAFVKDRFLSRLIWNSADIGSHELLEMKENFDLAFPRIRFCAVMIDVLDYSRISQRDDAEEVKMVEFAVVNITNELMDQSGIVYEILPRVNDTIAYIINYDQDDSDIKKVLENIFNTLQSLLKIIVIISVGGSADSIYGFSSSYEEAGIAINHARKSDRCGTVLYDDVKDLIVTDNIYYPTEKEFALMQSVKTGDLQATKKILNELYEVNFNRRDLEGDVLKYLIFSMTSTIIKLMDETYIDSDSLKHEYIKTYKQATQGTDYKNSFYALNEIFCRLCANVGERKKSQTSRIKNMLIEYINQNYNDKELSLDKMACQFHYSYNYLSNIFKDQIGYKFTDYLNHIRLQKAKELLETTPYSISYIAENVGYMSSNTFIKNFKKYYHMTPGQYREQMPVTIPGNNK